MCWNVRVPAAAVLVESRGQCGDAGVGHAQRLVAAGLAHALEQTGGEQLGLDQIGWRRETDAHV